MNGSRRLVAGTPVVVAVSTVAVAGLGWFGIPGARGQVTTLSEGHAYDLLLASGRVGSDRPASAAGEARRHACRLPKGATQDIASSIAVVYHRKTGAVDPTIRYSGCLRRTGRRRTLADVPEDDVYASTDRHDFRLNGTFVAWVETGEDHYGGGRTTIFSADISGGAASRTGYVGSFNGSQTNGPLTSADVVELHISSVGTAIWVQNVSTASPPYGLVAFGPGKTQTVLDEGPATAITDVRLRKTRVTWRHASAPRAAHLIPPRTHTR